MGRPLQCEVLRSTARRGLLLCTRQWGETTVSAAKAFHRAFTQPDSLIVVASPGARQSGEWMRRAGQMLQPPRHSQKGRRLQPPLTLLPNDSRIVGLPDAEEKVRGFSGLSMLVIDEAARVSEEMYASVLPMLITTDGDLWVISTPWGKKGFSMKSTTSTRFDHVFICVHLRPIKAVTFTYGTISSYPQPKLSILI